MVTCVLSSDPQHAGKKPQVKWFASVPNRVWEGWGGARKPEDSTHPPPPAPSLQDCKPSQSVSSGIQRETLSQKNKVERARSATSAPGQPARARTHTYKTKTKNRKTKTPSWNRSPLPPSLSAVRYKGKLWLTWSAQELTKG